MLTHRSQEKELLDLGPNYYSPTEFEHCMKMLFRVNRIFGFFRSTVKFLKKFSPTSTLLDVGCGGGLFLINLGKFFPKMHLTGIDISSEAITVANQELQNWQRKKSIENISFKLQPLDELKDSSDIVLTTMVCHHLSDDELICFLQQMLNISRRAVIINDLHRHKLAEFFYRIISPILFRNRLITHDGLISIRRGFKRHDWKLLLKKAGITHYKITWCFPFRWRVILWKN